MPGFAYSSERSKKTLKKISILVRKFYPHDEVFYVDEADINLNSKIGVAYMKKGKQLKVVTPGKNVKRYVAGVLNPRTGKLVYIFDSVRFPHVKVGHCQTFLLRPL